ncbi:type 4a pilus biogenesis protein PilO [Microbacterium sp. NPDC056736]|uniref:type 4a pilus biogenesis protein PilO n=1 Tax=Microbacterium sp. NPDC056736 TaxID=3345932 RepID=UPI00366F204F
MPKQIVTAIGLIVSLGIIALGISLVAFPLYIQAVGVDSQTATVASTNATYQSQVDNLREQEKNLDTINADVQELRSQIPAAAQLDDVFEVIGRASQTSGARLSSIAAGEQVPFEPRAGASTESAPVNPPAGSTGEDAQATDADATTSPPASSEDTSSAGRQQAEFAISASATSMEQATAFIDALRAGPRLLNSVTATIIEAGDGTIAVQVAALTYFDGEG